MAGLGGAAAAGLVGCSDGSGGSGSAGAATGAISAGDLLTQVQERGEMVFATEGTWSPWTFHNEADELTGFDIEVARAIAAELGVEPSFAEGKWDSLLAGLDAGRFDTMANGVSVTPERAEQYDFTEPYAYNRIVVITTQVTLEGSDLSVYEVGAKAMERYNLLQAYDMTVEAVVTDNGAIPSGASVKVYFVSERTEDALLVPTDAVYYDGGKTYVYTFSSISQEELAQTEGGSTSTVMEGNQAGTVHKIEVETGLSDGENTEILSGLEADAPVILTWTSQLYEDAQVQALPETESGAAEAATEAAAEAETEGAAGGDAA